MKAGHFRYMMLFLGAVSLSGCIMSSISESISESFQSSSKSSTSSSGESKDAYLRDIKQYTALYSRSNTDVKGLEKGITDISKKHGVADWEAYSATYTGIGEGLAKSGLAKGQVDLIIAGISHGDMIKVAAIQQGMSQSR